MTVRVTVRMAMAVVVRMSDFSLLLRLRQHFLFEGWVVYFCMAVTVTMTVSVGVGVAMIVIVVIVVMAVEAFSQMEVRVTRVENLDLDAVENEAHYSDNEH